MNGRVASVEKYVAFIKAKDCVERIDPVVQFRRIVPDPRGVEKTKCRILATTPLF